MKMLVKRCSDYRRKFEVFFSLSTVGLLLSQSVAANIVGNDSQNFNPVPGKNAFVTVNSSSTLETGRYNLGLFANYGINTLPYESPDRHNRIRINDSVASLDLLAAVGVHERFELGIAVPFMVYQKVRENDTRGEYEKPGNTELRPVIKWAFYRSDLAGAAIVSSVNINRLVDDPFTGASRGPTLNLELAYDVKVGPVLLGANIGYRKRSPGKQIEGSLVEPVTSRYLGSLAARYDLTSRLALIGEAFGSIPDQRFDNDTDRQNKNSEALAGLRYAAASNLNIDGGIGTETNNGLATADWRIYGGLVAEFGEKKELPQPVKAPIEPSAEDIPEGPPDEVFVFNNINFEFDSDFRVLPGALSELKRLHEFLGKKQYKAIVVEGHTDFKGTVEYNDDLSLRRARTVRRHLIKHYQLDQEKVIAVGYGERRPATHDMSDQGRQINRRVEVKIYYP
jgi:outer membrane protein OmpA-like peptidoglycan-associated protein